MYSTLYSPPEMFHVKQRSWFLPVGRCNLSPAGAAQSNLSQSDASVISVSESTEARWVCAGARIGACQSAARKHLPCRTFLSSPEMFHVKQRVARPTPVLLRYISFKASGCAGAAYRFSYQSTASGTSGVQGVILFARIFLLETANSPCSFSGRESPAQLRRAFCRSDAAGRVKKTAESCRL